MDFNINDRDIDMFGKEESPVSIKEVKKKKNVSWNDGQESGKIEGRFLQIGTAATPPKAELDKSIRKLMAEGYPEVEATAITGKPITPSGKVLMNTPTFYESRRSIENRLAEAIREKEDLEGEREANRYSFFSATNIGLGVAALAVATIFVLRHK